MESSLPWTVESTLFGCVIWLIVSLAAATWLHPPLFLCPLCIMLRIKAFLRLSLSATSLPSSFTILSGPLPLRSPYSCICSDAFGCISHSVFTCCIDHSLHSSLTSSLQALWTYPFTAHTSSLQMLLRLCMLAVVCCDLQLSKHPVQKTRHWHVNAHSGTRAHNLPSFFARQLIVCAYGKSLFVWQLLELRF